MFKHTHLIKQHSFFLVLTSASGDPITCGQPRQITAYTWSQCAVSSDYLWLDFIKGWSSDFLSTQMLSRMHQKNSASCVSLTTSKYSLSDGIIICFYDTPKAIYTLYLTLLDCTGCLRLLDGVHWKIKVEVQLTCITERFFYFYVKYENARLFAIIT